MKSVWAGVASYWFSCMRTGSLIRACCFSLRKKGQQTTLSKHKILICVMSKSVLCRATVPFVEEGLYIYYVDD
jgi:hypothetical protein